MTETRRLTLLPGAVRFSGNGIADRQAIILATNQTVDSYGEVVVTSGARTANFRKRGGPILRDHDSSRPIARALSDTVGSNGLQLLIQFPPEGVSRDADEAYGLMKADILRGVSIGFQPIKTEPMDPKRPYGPQRHLEWDLVEVSITALGANPDARVLAKANKGAGSSFSTQVKARINKCALAAGQPPRYAPDGRPMSDTERRAWLVAQRQRQQTKLLLDQPRYAHLWRKPFEERLREIRARSRSK